MPWAAPRHCAAGHPPFTGARCPICAAAAKAAAEARRPSANERGYTGKWAKARAEFLRLHPRCACGATATVVDHVVPHKGDQKLFWQRSNWQPMCKPCHDRKTVREDGGFGNPVKGRGDDRICPRGKETGGVISCATSPEMTTSKWEFWG
ncbi:HNH endonuclease [Cereibacter azotoformans]|uniref:Putative HNH nuclease YajD n=1 Tax=Cereibacter azotoformans TaxID=43057 RepID=A0A2T5JXR4_9RHOB|nr:HNH endonuclease [Cereibacter azotoformans]PTR14961.1 5-methylcytosine-specific restriction protein A [Cereibacter azotoformans]